MTDAAHGRDRQELFLEHRGEEDGLIRRVREHDAAAFEIIVRRYTSGLVGFAYLHTHSRETAEDIVQDVFLNIWANRSDWTLTHSLKTYLFQSVRKRVINHRRDIRTAERHLGELAEGLALSASDYFPGQTGAALDEADLDRALGQAVAELPERCRQVFTLNRAQHLSYREIAAVLGISVKTVEIHMTRALAALRVRLADWKR
jgi:RNA polymerase sigma-70 factor (family 1)